MHHQKAQTLMAEHQHFTKITGNSRNPLLDILLLVIDALTLINPFRVSLTQKIVIMSEIEVDKLLKETKSSLLHFILTCL